jgi:transcription-repair coupling factor (superfamily II helicase)
MAKQPAPAPTTFSARFAELSGKDDDELRALLANDEAPENDDALDPMPAVLPAEGTTATRLADLTKKIDAGAVGYVAGTVAGARAAVVAAWLSSAPMKRAVVVVPDGDDCKRVADDIAQLLGFHDSSAANIACFVGWESSPYAEASPDRKAALARLAVLGPLSAHAQSGPRVLVVAAAALVRKTIPRAIVAKYTLRVTAEEELDRDALIGHLVDAGYVRAPIVEDPGSFAVRGSLVDAWPPQADRPVRIELYGDLIVSIKPFEAEEQKTTDATLPEILLGPAREGLLTKEFVERAKDRVTALGDAIDLPTSKLRALVDDVCNGRAFFGADGFLPAYYPALEPLTAYLAGDETIFLFEPPGCVRAMNDALEEMRRDLPATRIHFLPDAFAVDEEVVLAALPEARRIGVDRLALLGAPEPGLGALAYADEARTVDLAARDHDDLERAGKAARQQRGRGAGLNPLLRRIRHFKEHGFTVFLAARAEVQGERLVALLRPHGVNVKVVGKPFAAGWLHNAVEPAYQGLDALIVTGPLARGFLLPADGIAVITEEEIFGARARRAPRTKAKDVTRPFLEDLRALAVGDFVVHVDHGIGRYRGLVHQDVGDHIVDLLVVEYSGGDKLYLPSYRLNQIQKYAGGESADPKIDRLGGQTFAKTKAKVRKAVREMADELLRLYAEREAAVGEAIPAIDEDYRTFEATFPFEETVDQAQAIGAVNKDLESEKPMDRLVCGDVGFGKTEVAIRAAFRVAMAGRQVAVLCPTTVLAQQHFRTFENRMGGYPIKIRALSRFQTAKEQAEVLREVKEGRCDIVIGTHRLLSKDLHFKHLGLLVVDEEQRFGVTHKERIKAIRASVDVLTLSATPIPRTLQMAIGGLRDLSLITTPPSDRRAVRTIVTKFDEQVIREAVERELSRGGQVFYVYNRVEGIHERAGRLQDLVPNARIAVGHGQMAKTSTKIATQTTDGGTDKGESALEKVMLDFVDGRYDILVATAIVESGLDIPRANTIIVDRADHFGLAQLYQLRGRVGRSKERAYCYLVVPPLDGLSEDARARIEALEQHTELGSGFKIASLDLELRGAGNILGGEQSGNVATVGFDLFCQMLDEAVHELRGETVVHDVDPELSFDVTAILPEEYIGDVGLRLSLYKRLATAIDEAMVDEIGIELEDRFGPPPEAARRFLHQSRLKTELRRLKVLGCEANARYVTLHLRADTPLDPAKILPLVRAPRSTWKLTPDMKLTCRFESLSGNGLTNCEAMLGELSRCLKDE